MKSKLPPTLTLFLSLTFTHAEEVLPIDNNIYCYTQTTIEYTDIFCTQEDEEINTDTSTKNIYLNDTLLMTVDTTGTTITPNYYLTDHLGSTEKTLNSTGTLLTSTDYHPYGEVKTQSGTAPQRGYIGEVYDGNTKYNYLNARYNDPGRGQFVSQDYTFWNFEKNKESNNKFLTNPQYQNSYSYGLNNPINMKDPDGKIPIDTIADVGFVLYDIGSGLNNLVRGNYEAAKTDGQALLGDLAGTFVPYATGFGAVIRGGKAVDKGVSVGEGVSKIMNKLPEGKSANHVFSGKEGKFADTLENRKYIEKISNDSKNYLGSDTFGKSWYSSMNKEGKQVYTYIKDGVIKGAGKNNEIVDITKTQNLTK